MKTDILLLYMPTADQKMLPMPPLGIAVLAASLRSLGFTVVIEDIEMKYWAKDRINVKLLRGLVKKIPLDYNNPKICFLDEERVLAYLANGRGDRRLLSILKEWESLLSISPAEIKYVGFSVMGAFQLSSSLCFAKFLKDTYDVKTIFGGSFITEKTDVLMKQYDFIDYLITGEAEISLGQLLRGEVENTSNLIFRKKGQIMVNPASSEYPANLSVDFEGLPIELYRQGNILLFPYETSRGCRNQCNFCITRKKKLFLKDTRLVSNELSEIKQRYGVSHFVFFDNAINVDRSFPVRLCEQLIKDRVKIRWSSYFIPEYQDTSYFKLLREAGCIQLRWGIETADEGLLTKMNKCIKLEDVVAGLQRSNNAGIWNHLLFIVGHPGERLRDVYKTIKFITKNKCYFKSALVAPFEYDRVDLRGDSYGYRNATYTNGRFLEKGFLGIKFFEFEDKHLELKRSFVCFALGYAGIKPSTNFSKNKVSHDLLKDQFIFKAFANANERDGVD